MTKELAHVYWIGGSPCSGKSSIADLLAEKHGMTVYRCDDAYFRHQTVISAEAHPVFSRLAHASCDELWLRPVAQQVREEIELYREEFPLILADLASLPPTRPVVAEGAALLPDLLAGLRADPNRAIWVVPTEPFQRERYAKREWRHEVLKDCSDPELAWRNWMDRDAGFANNVAKAAGDQGYRVVVVDGARSIDANLRLVEAHFGL